MPGWGTAASLQDMASIACKQWQQSGLSCIRCFLGQIRPHRGAVCKVGCISCSNEARTKTHQHEEDMMRCVSCSRCQYACHAAH